MSNSPLKYSIYVDFSTNCFDFEKKKKDLTSYIFKGKRENEYRQKERMKRIQSDRIQS